MYATTGDVLRDHTARSARPRPLASRCTARTPRSCWARRQASSHVRSVEALSAMVMTQRSGKRLSR